MPRRFSLLRCIALHFHPSLVISHRSDDSWFQFICGGRVRRDWTNWERTRASELLFMAHFDRHQGFIPFPLGFLPFGVFFRVLDSFSALVEARRLFFILFFVMFCALQKHARNNPIFFCTWWDNVFRHLNPQFPSFKRWRGVVSLCQKPLSSV